MEIGMLTLLGVLVAIAPFVGLIGLLAWTSWRERLRRDAQARQIALTDSIHERLGAVAAPVVRRRHRGWQVRIAVPFERPATTEALLAIVMEAFALPDGDRRSLEIVLTPQLHTPATTPAGAREVRWESASWT
jgi:hypothetical protein